VPAVGIRENKDNLSLSRYQEAAHEDVSYEPPQAILAKLRSLEHAIIDDLDALERML